MPGKDGLELLQQVQQMGMQICTAIMSGQDVIENRAEEIRQMEIGAVFFKPLNREEILQFLVDLEQGDQPKLRFSSLGVEKERAPEVDGFGSLIEFIQQSDSLLKAEEEILHNLVDQTSADLAVLFRYDPESNSIRIERSKGVLGMDLDECDGLIASPVKDVIFERRILWEKQVPDTRGGAFKNLLRVIQFESCIGVPIFTQGRCEYALFIFHHDDDGFSRFRVRDTQASAALVTLALENDALNQRIQSASPMLLQGELAAAYNHEIYNKLTSLDLQLEHMASMVAQLQKEYPALRAAENQAGLLGPLEEVTGKVKELLGTAQSFRKVITGERIKLEIDIAALICQINSQIKPVADKYGVKTRLKIAENLPSVYGNSTALYHIVFNLAINAIQHLHHKAGERLVEIGCVSREKQVEIRVIDNGPGIHHRLWQRVFELGYTTREGGSGLGLYIAKSLARSMHGEVFVESSRIKAGSTFCVRLQAGE
jgi:signal transduction histidine kinase